jgi:hypothetical protein
MHSLLVNSSRGLSLAFSISIQLDLNDSNDLGRILMTLQINCRLGNTFLSCHQTTV